MSLLKFLLCNFIVLFLGQRAIAISPSFLLQRAQELRLGQNSEWLAINHYRTSGSGFSSLIRGPFFLSPTGSSDPQGELEKTISLFFDPSKEVRQKIQCRYLSRREFLQRQLKISAADFEVCEFSNDWLKRLDVQSISLVFASAHLGNPASSFGHTLLKLRSQKNSSGLELLDYGVNFAARTDETSGALYALYGLFGYFPGVYGMAPYHQMIKEYVSLEGRDLWEYQLGLTPEEVQRLVLHLLELEGSYFDYYFLSDNCSSQILDLLEIARPGLRVRLKNSLFTIPLDAVKSVAQSPGLVRKVEYHSSLQTEFKNQYRSLKQASSSILIDGRALRHKPAAQLSTPELELLQKVTAIDQVQDFRKFQSRQFELSLERSKRKEVSSPPQVSVPMDPTQSENSVQVRASILDLNGESHQRFVFRTAFRELLSRESVWTGSNLEVLAAEIDRGPQDSWNLEELRVLKIQSAPPVNPFFYPKSWSLDFGAHRKYFEKTTVGYLEGRFGLSVSPFDQIFLSSWLVSRADSWVPSGALMGGAALQFEVLWTPALRSDFDYLVLTQNQKEFRKTVFRGIYDFGFDLSAFAKWEERVFVSQQENLKEVGFSYSF